MRPRHNHNHNPSCMNRSDPERKCDASHFPFCSAFLIQHQRKVCGMLNRLCTPASLVGVSCGKKCSGGVGTLFYYSYVSRSWQAFKAL